MNAFFFSLYTRHTQYPPSAGMRIVYTPEYAMLFSRVGMPIDFPVTVFRQRSLSYRSDFTDILAMRS